IYPAASSLLDWGFANVDEVTPVGYLVDPLEPMLDEAVAPVPATANGGDADGATADDQGAAGAGSDSVPAAATTDGGGISWAWVLALLGAMVVGLLMVIQGIRALRTPPPAGRRARHLEPAEQKDRIDAGSSTF
ncbi:MAG: hypothetical protein VW362_02920, partial [Candidatus Nanopelagicales bacterium]